MSDLNVNNHWDIREPEKDFSNEFSMYIDYLADKRDQIKDLLN